MNHYQIAWLERFLRPAVHFLTHQWPVIRPLLRLATSLTAATVAFQLTAEGGLGIWLALGAGLTSWNFLFKAQPGYMNAVETTGSTQVITNVVAQCPVESKQYWSHEDHAYEDCPTNDWYDPTKD